MKKIYICSKYRGNIDENIKYAQKICRKIILNGDIPIAPHLYFTQFLNDKIEKERNLAIDINLKIIDRCDFLLICNKNVSDGMKKEIEYAKKIKKEIKEWIN